TILPGLTTTLTVPANSELYIQADGGFAPTSATNGTTCVVDVALVIDGSIVQNAGFKRMAATNITVTNGATNTIVGIVNWSLGENAELAAGSHTIAVAAALASNDGVTPFSTNAATVSGNNTDVRQGQLTVVIIKK